jgi:biotin-dependent carboxylase-like uncharacterized protein
VSIPVFEIESAGVALTVQDAGRVGWRRFGVPASGCMDDHAALWANRLLDNPPQAAMLEVQFQGAMLTALENTWIAITGADLRCNLPTWRALQVAEGQSIRFTQNQAGLWAYLAVEGGIQSECILGSRSTYARGRIGTVLGEGEVLCRGAQHSFTLPSGVAGRITPWTEHRDYAKPPPLRVWVGPQFETFSAADRKTFFASEWTVTSQSDRSGYRLLGPALNAKDSQIISEPVRVGSIQVPQNGQPIVTMRDGPTVGGYPKLGLVDARDLSWLAQCRPGQKVRFRPAA